MSVVLKEGLTWKKMKRAFSGSSSRPLNSTKMKFFFFSFEQNINEVMHAIFVSANYHVTILDCIPNL
jgi:hypothetical protein